MSEREPTLRDVLGAVNELRGEMGEVRIGLGDVRGRLDRVDGRLDGLTGEVAEQGRRLDGLLPVRWPSKGAGWMLLLAR